MSPEATPLLMMDNGVASSDILLYGLTRGDADSLALLDCQHYHGLLKWPPFRRLQWYLVAFLSVFADSQPIQLIPPTGK